MAGAEIDKENCGLCSVSNLYIGPLWYRNSELRMFSYQCTHCKKSASLGAIYGHLKTIYGRDAYVGYRLKEIPQWQDQQCDDCEWFFCGPVGAHNCNRNQIDRLNFLESEASRPETTETVPSSKSFVAGEFEYKCQGKLFKSFIDNIQ